MQTIAQGYKSMKILVNINRDRVLTTATVIASLYISAYILLG